MSKNIIKKFVERTVNVVRKVTNLNGVSLVKKVNYNFDENVKMKVNTVIDKKSSILRKDSYHLFKVVISHDADKLTKTAETTVVRQGENRFLDYAGVVEKVVKTSKITKSFSKEDNYTDDFIVIEVAGELNEEIIGESLFINTSNNKVFMKTNLEGKDRTGQLRPIFLELVNNKPVYSIGRAKEYKMLFHSSGSLKKGQSFWYNTEIAKDSLEIIESVIPGVIKLASKKMTQQQAVKFATRPALAWSQNVLMSYVDKVGVFNGMFDKTKFKDENGEMVFNNTQDGQCYIRASYVRDLFNLRTAKEAIGMIFQSRLYGVYKFQAITINDELYDEMESECLSRHGGKIKYIGAGSKSVMLLDSNCQKAKIDAREVLLSLMAVGKVTEGTTSKQFIEKVFVEASKQGKLNEAMDMLEEAGLDFMVSELKKLFDSEEKEVSVTESYILDILKKKCPNNPVVVNRAYNDLTRTIGKMADKLKMPLYCEYNGKKTSTIYNAVVAGDITSIFGDGLIPANFIVFGKFSKKFAKIHKEFGKDSSEYKELEAKFKKFIAIKYPSMYTREFASGEIMDLIDLFELINSSNLTDSRKSALTIYFDNMADATAMFPALREVFETLAGMDTDFDKIQIIFDKYMVTLLYGKQIALKISPVGTGKAVAKGKNKLGKKLNDAGIQTEKEFILDGTFFSKLYKLQSKYEGLIGIITFYNNRVNSMTVEALNGNFTPAIHFLTEAVGSTLGLKGKYHVDRTVVNPDYVDEMLKQISTLEWSNENIIAFLDDCSKVFRLYQETAIDGGKTGIYLILRLTVKSVITASLLPITVGEDEDGNPILIRKEYEKSEIELKDGRKINTIYLSDAMSELQDRLTETANNEIREIYENNKEKFRYTDEEIKKFKDAIAKVSSSKSGKTIIDNLYTIKSIYNDRTSKYIESMAEINSNDNDFEEIMADLNENYKYDLSILSNSARRLLNRIKYVNDANKDAGFRGLIMLGVSVVNPKTGAVSVMSKNRFAYNLTPDLTYTALFGSNTYTATGKVLQIGKASVGEVEFIDGFSKEGLVIKENYTGKAYFDHYRDGISGEIYTTVTAQKEIEFEALNEDEFILVVKKEEADKLSGTSNGLLDLVTDNSALSVTKDGMFISKNESSDYVFVGESHLFDGKKNDEYGISYVYNSEILINQNPESKKAFWKKQAVYVIKLVK